MPESFALTEKQNKAFDSILSSGAAIGGQLAKQEAKFDAFNALIGPERILTDIKSKIPAGFKGQALVKCDPSNSKEVAVALAKFVSLSGQTPVLVLMNYNYKTVLSALKSGGVLGGAVIIDTVSKSIFPVSDTSDVFFIDSLRDLTQLQIRMTNIIGSMGKIAFIFDSLGLLDLYHEEDVVSRFLYSVTKLLRKGGIPGYFVSAGKDSSKRAQFFDEEIELKKYL